MRLLMAKQDPQGQGSAVTYARRYSYCAALGIVADEDDDGQAASQPAPAARTTRQPPRADPETGEVHASGGKPITEKQIGFVRSLAKDRGLAGDDLKVFVDAHTGREVPALADLTSKEASSLIDAIRAIPVEEGA